MAGKIKGITVEIGGDTTKLGDALASSEKKTRDLQSELRAVEKALKFNPGNVELIAQKQELLKDIVAETTDKLDTLQDTYAQVQAKAERGDIGQDQFREFQREVIETESKLTHFNKKLNETEDEVEDVGESAKDTEGGFTIMKGALADIVSNVITSAVSSIGNLIGSLMELSEATEEYRQMQGKLEGSAKTFGYSVEFANDKYKEFYGYMGDDQMATNAITNLMGLGTSTDSVSKLAEGAIAVWSAYGDSIPIEGLTEALNETAQVGKVTGSLADALNWAGISEDEFNAKLEKCSSTQERADLIAKTLNDTYGDSKKKYDELNGSITDANEAELKLKETQAQLGEAVAPVNTAFTNLKAQALEAITPIVEKLAEKFMELLKWLQEHPVALKVITALIIALATAFTVLAGALAIQGIIVGVTKAFAFLNTTLLANPIVLITALLAGLVAGFIYLWNNCDGFREFWLNLWDKVKTFFVNAWNSISTFCTKTIPKIINNVVNWFKQLPSKIWTWLLNTVNRVTSWGSNMASKAKSSASKFVSNAVNTIKGLPGKVWSWLSNTASKVVSWGSNLASKGKQAGTKLLNSVVNTVKGIPGKIKSIGGDLVSGLWNGISDKVSWITGKLKGFKDSVMSSLKKFFGINSPSRLMRDEIGYNLSAGIAEGIDSKEPVDAIKKMSSDIMKGAENINPITLRRQMDATFNGSVKTSDQVLSRLDNILSKLESKTQIILDTGTLVGETVDAYDRALSNKHTQLARGW